MAQRPDPDRFRRLPERPDPERLREEHDARSHPEEMTPEQRERDWLEKFGLAAF